MAQLKPDENATLNQVLELVSQLTPDEQDQVVEELKLQWLRREMAKAEESVAQGKVRPAEEVFAKLEEKYQRKKAGQVKVSISDDASADLEEIGDFIAQDNPDAAISFVRRLRSRCLDLSQFPDAGRKREEIRRGLRSVTEGDYVILYRTLNADSLVIMRIIHGKRDLRKLSFSDT